MIDLPEFENAWDYENGFYLTCDITRMSKMIAHYEFFKQTIEIPGAIVECGVFKGASLSRFTMLRELFGNPFSKPVIGFDAFGPFPETGHPEDINIAIKGMMSRSLLLCAI